MFEDNVEQRIVSFAMEDDPVSICLVFDISGSMAGDLREMRHAAAQFFKTSNPGDEFCLVELARDVHLAVPLTQNAADVDYRLMFSKGGGSTALLDGVYMGLNAVRKSRNMRKALVIISDGGENHSRYSLGEVKNAVVESDVLIYAIGSFGNGMGSNYSDQIVLKKLMEQSGGRMFPVDWRSMRDFADKGVIDLRNRYLLGYAPTDMARDGRYHHIRVMLAPPRGLPKLQAHWRTGYYAPSERSPALGEVRPDPSRSRSWVGWTPPQRTIPSFFIFDCSVVRFIPRWAAAPFGPPTTPAVCSSTRRM